jgi:succinate-acetate transporter protein
MQNAGLQFHFNKGIIGNRKICSSVRERGAKMDRMFRVLGFWTLVIALMSLAGDMMAMSLIFFFQTVVFILLGYLKLSERTYILTFWGYMVIAFLGFTYWSVFKMPLA